MMHSFYIIALAIYQPSSGALPMEVLHMTADAKSLSQSKNLAGSRSFANSFSIEETPNTGLQAEKDVHSQPFWMTGRPETHIRAPPSKVVPMGDPQYQETKTGSRFYNDLERFEQEKLEQSQTEAKPLEKTEPPTHTSGTHEDSSELEFFDAADDFIEGERLLKKGPRPLETPASQEFRSSYHKFLGSLSSKPSFPEKVRYLFGKVRSYLPDESHWKALEGYDQNWLDKARKETQNRLNLDVLRRFEKRISGSQTTPYAFLKVDPYDPEPLVSLMSQDIESFNQANEYFYRKLGHEETLRRVTLSNYQHAQFRILKDWDNEVEFIAKHLNLDKSEVQEAGKLFGADAFPVFRGMNPGKTLEDLEQLRNKFGKFSLYKNWEDFIGDDEVQRRRTLLKTLSTTGYQKIDPEQLSAWQMQGLDINRMLKVLAHSQPKRNGQSIAETVLKGEDKRMKEREIVLFLGDLTGDNWQNNLEHEQLLMSLPEPSRLQYNKVRAIVTAERENTKTKSPELVEVKADSQGSVHVHGSSEDSGSPGVKSSSQKQVDAKTRLLRWINVKAKVSGATAKMEEVLEKLMRPGSQLSGRLVRTADGHPPSHASGKDTSAPPTGPPPTVHETLPSY